MSSSSAHDRQRSPSRIAAPTPNALGRAEPLVAAVQRREAPVRRGHAATRVAAVHDVVVDERAGLQQLERGRRGHRLLAVGAAGAAPAPVGERRAQALAAAQEVGERLGERREVGADVVEDRHLLREEVVEALLHADAQVLRVERRAVPPWRSCPEA